MQSGGVIEAPLRWLSASVQLPLVGVEIAIEKPSGLAAKAIAEFLDCLEGDVFFSLFDAIEMGLSNAEPLGEHPLSLFAPESLEFARKILCQVSHNANKFCMRFDTHAYHVTF